MHSPFLQHRPQIQVAGGVLFVPQTSPCASHTVATADTEAATQRRTVRPVSLLMLDGSVGNTTAALVKQFLRVNETTSSTG